MPITLSTITSKTKTVAVQWEGETVTIGYSPAQYTPAYIDALSVKQKDAEATDDATEQGRKFSEMACEVVKSWDIQAEDGTTLPVTVDVMSQLPVALIQAMIQAVTGDLRPKASGDATSKGSF